MEVCGEADSAAAATASLRRAKPDVVIVDLGLGDMHGLRLIETIRSSDPDIKIMVLSAYSETLYGERALRSGADSYVNKQQAPGTIVGAIRATAAGKRYLSKELADAVKDPAVKAGFEKVGAETMWMPLDQVKQWHKGEIAKYRDIITKAGIEKIE